MELDLTKLSRTMSHALRHAPQQYGLELDNEGWVSIDTLLEALRRHQRSWRHLQFEQLEQVLTDSSKQRFEIRDGRIRAFYGHSVPTKIEKQSEIPPARLFHGTTPQVLEVIRREGLKPMGRQYVHLSAEPETAIAVAKRRTGRPVILEVRALEAYESGLHFYLGNDTVWLADAIPSEYLLFP